jgi:hypothetical protein
VLIPDTLGGWQSPDWQYDLAIWIVIGEVVAFAGLRPKRKAPKRRQNA